MCRTKTCVQNITGFNNQLEWSPPQAHQIKIWLRLALNQSQNVKIKFVFTFPLRKQHNNNWAWNLHYVIASLVFGRLQFMWNTNIHDLILAYQIHQKKKKKKAKRNTSSSIANLPWGQRFIISSKNLNSQSISHDGWSKNNYLYDFMIR